MLTLTDAQKAEVIRDAYKKHAEELRAIEDAQGKLTGVMLGIFGAGASFLAGTKNPIPFYAKWGLTIVIVAIIGVGTIIAFFRRGARKEHGPCSSGVRRRWVLRVRLLYRRGKVVWRCFSKVPEEGLVAGFSDHPGGDIGSWLSIFIVER